MYIIVNENYLMHHGIKGQKWGVRRYQNADGSYTQAGRSRYGFGQKMSNTGRKIRDYMTVKDENGKRHLSKKGKNVIIGAGVAAVATTGAIIAGKRLANIAMSKSNNKAIENLGQEISDGKELVMHWYNKSNMATESAGRAIASANMRKAQSVLDANRVEMRQRLEYADYLLKHPLKTKIK